MPCTVKLCSENCGSIVIFTITDYNWYLIVKIDKRLHVYIEVNMVGES